MKFFMSLVVLSFWSLTQAQEIKNDSIKKYTLATPGAELLEQKVRAVLQTFPCQSGAAHRLTVVRFSNQIPGAVGTRIGTAALNEAGAKQISVGINSERNVVVLKDMGSNGLDAYLYLCPSSWNGSNTNIVVQSAQLETEIETSAFNPYCSFTQVVQFNATLQISGGFPAPYAFFPVDVMGSVPRVCEVNN